MTAKRAKEWTDITENTADSQRIEMRDLTQWNRDKEGPKRIGETYPSKVAGLRR